MWLYRSPIGNIFIKLFQQGYGIVINNEVYGFYKSAVAAADDVYTHTTGCYDWDKLDCKISDVPTDIYEWEKC